MPYSCNRASMKKQQLSPSNLVFKKDKKNVAEYKKTSHGNNRNKMNNT